ncbi:MAG TPA: ABC transporter permease [Thermodesulfobacteriota bacterium]|nr:ABC transporter permease [Deltaproteobacteria bacterium]HNR12847.1 ABC transporter permease [Thermodesulfobacteriota bacterium]HNU72179.1 ABC transporter permease [Thermodesulfobacteriota bacterium]HOC38856.1 ABC transporter permease [Thermodesulfobacteriota bacterium]
MTRYILGRILNMIPLLIGITIVSFLVINLAPGSPISVQTDMNPKMTAEARERLRAFYGLDKPLHIQYYNWIKHLATFDLGRSLSTDNRPVIDKIKERLPITISINALALLLIMLVALPLGVLSAVYHNTLFDRLTTVFVFIGFAIPSFWLALLLMIYFGIHLGWLPISGLKSINFEYLTPANQLKDYIVHLVLPVFVSAFGGLAGLSRYSRSNMLEVIRQDYITTARAKGLNETRVIYKHALRNALLPVVTILGLSVPGLIGGSVIFETIFAIPGMGQLFYGSVMARDYFVIMGILVIGAILTMAGNLLADISYAIVDPRIRIGKQ